MNLNLNMSIVLFDQFYTGESSRCDVVSAISKLSPSQWYVDIEVVGEYLQELDDIEPGGEGVFYK